IAGGQGRNPYHGTPALMRRRRARTSRDWPDFGDTLKMRGLCGLPIPLERFSGADVTWKCRPRSECLTAQPGYCALPRRSAFNPQSVIAVPELNTWTDMVVADVNGMAGRSLSAAWRLAVVSNRCSAHQVGGLARRTAFIS